MSHYDRSLRSGSRISRSRSRPDTEDGDEESEGRFSPDSYLRNLAQRQSQRLKVRRRSRHNRRDRHQEKQALTLAERIVIAKLDPEHFSMQATRSPDLQQAVSMTPRPPLSELIQQYRRIETLEKDLGHSMVDGIKATQQHMKRVEDHVQQPIIVEGAEQNVYMSPSPPPTPAAAQPPGHHAQQQPIIVVESEQNINSSQSPTGKPGLNLFDSVQRTISVNTGEHGTKTNRPSSTAGLPQQPQTTSHGDVECKRGQYSSSSRRGTAEEAAELLATHITRSERTAGAQSPHNTLNNASGEHRGPLKPVKDAHHQHHHHSSLSLYEAVKAQRQRRLSHEGEEGDDRQSDATAAANTTTATTLASNPPPPTAHTAAAVAAATVAEQPSIASPRLNDESKHYDTRDGVEQSSRGAATAKGSGRWCRGNSEGCSYYDNDLVLIRADHHGDACACACATPPGDGTYRSRRRRSHGVVVAEPDGSRCCTPETIARVSPDSAMHNAGESRSRSRQHSPAVREENSTQVQHDRSTPVDQEDRTLGLNVEGRGTTRDESDVSESSNRTTDPTSNMHTVPPNVEDARFDNSIRADSDGRDKNQDRSDADAYSSSRVDDGESSPSPAQHESRETTSEKSETEGFGEPRNNQPDTTSAAAPASRDSKAAVAQDDRADETGNNTDYYEQIVVRDEGTGSDIDGNPVLSTTTTITIARASNVLERPKDADTTTPRRRSDASSRNKQENNNQERARPSSSSDQVKKRSKSQNGLYHHDENKRSDHDRNEANRRKSAEGFSPQRETGRNERRGSIGVVRSRSRSDSGTGNPVSPQGEVVRAGPERAGRPSETRAEDSSPRPTPRRQRKTSTQRAEPTSPRSKLSPCPISAETPSPRNADPITTSGKPLKPLRSDIKVRFRNNKSDITVNYSDEEDDGSDSDDDDRVYDFIGLSRERSYTLPEVVFRRKPSIYSDGKRMPLAPRSSLLHKDTNDIRPGRFTLHSGVLRTTAYEASKTQFPALTCPMHRRCSLSMGSNGSHSRVGMERSSDRERHFSSPTLKLPALVAPEASLYGSTSTRPVRRKSEGQVREKLPDISQSVSLVGNKQQLEETENHDREHRVMGLYHDLRHFNAYCRTPSTLRVNVSRRTSDLDMRIEWSRRLPAVETSSLRIQYHRNSKGREHTLTSSRRAADETSGVKLPKIEDKTQAPKKFRRNFSEKFIFLDDEEEALFPPSVEVLRQGGARSGPDVAWFIQPGVASERCDVGFAGRSGGGAGAGASLDRKSKAWASLKNKCLPRVHIMRSLEVKSFLRRPVPKLRLDFSGVGKGSQVSKSPR